MRTKLFALAFFALFCSSESQPNNFGPARDITDEIVCAENWVEKNRGFKERLVNLFGWTLQDFGISVALISGVQRYPDLRGNLATNLTPVRRDIYILSRMFKCDQHFDMVVLLDGTNFTKENLTNVLSDRLPPALRPAKSRFVWAHSGHGTQKTDGKNVEGFLFTSFTESEKKFEQMISLDEIKSALSETVNSAFQSLILINSCNSGGMIEGIPFGDGVVLHPASGAHVITSSSHLQQSYAFKDDGAGNVREDPPSLFFESVVLGIGQREADTNKNGVIPATELYAYLHDRVSTVSSKLQDPQLDRIRLDKGHSGVLSFVVGDEPMALFSPASSVGRLAFGQHISSEALTFSGLTMTGESFGKVRLQTSLSDEIIEVKNSEIESSVRLTFDPASRTVQYNHLNFHAPKKFLEIPFEFTKFGDVTPRNAVLKISLGYDIASTAPLPSQKFTNRSDGGIRIDPVDVNETDPRRNNNKYYFRITIFGDWNVTEDGETLEEGVINIHEPVIISGVKATEFEDTSRVRECPEPSVKLSKFHWGRISTLADTGAHRAALLGDQPLVEYENSVIGLSFNIKILQIQVRPTTSDGQLNSPVELTGYQCS